MKRESQPLRSLETAFWDNGRLNRPALVIFLAINALVLANAVLHDPLVGYDAPDHFQNIRILPWQLPGPSDSREFFSPPLPYLLPSFLDKVCLGWPLTDSIQGDGDPCLRLAGKFAQILNFLLSVGVTLTLLKIGQVLYPGNRHWKISALLLLGVMTVYYKTFSQVRGEPYVVFFTALGLYLVARILTRRDVVTGKDGLALGVVLGLLALSRQWGFMLFPAILGLIPLSILADRDHGRNVATALALGLAVSSLVCGWFYLGLFAKYGSPAAFNRSPRPFAFSNQPTSFYRNTGFKDAILFRSPTRGTFDNQFVPIFYSEVWGDYWGYFALIPDRASLTDKRYQPNADTITPYLGRVNALGLLPTLLYAIGTAAAALSIARKGLGRDKDRARSIFTAFLLMVGFISFVLYLYFLIRYTTDSLDTTNKGSYMLHVLMIFPLLGAAFLEEIRRRLPRAYALSLMMVALVWTHNVPAMITHYNLQLWQPPTSRIGAPDRAASRPPGPSPLRFF